MADTDPRINPFELGAGLIASKPSDLVDAVLRSTDKQVAEKGIGDAEAREDFVLSTDALNYWRIVWRCSLEWGTRGFDEGLASEIKTGICAARGYELERFTLERSGNLCELRAKEGTEDGCVLDGPAGAGRRRLRRGR